MNVSGKEPMIGCCCPCLICWNEVFSVVRVSFKYVSFQIVSFLCTSSIHQNGLHNRFCRWKMFKQQEQLSRISGLLQLQIWRTRNVNLCNRILYVSGQRDREQRGKDRCIWSHHINYNHKNWNGEYCNLRWCTGRTNVLCRSSVFLFFVVVVFVVVILVEPFLLHAVLVIWTDTRSD